MSKDSNGDHEDSTGPDNLWESAEPLERCPLCNELLEHESKDPLEEYCINPAMCEYYRAELGDGEIVVEGF